MRRAQFVAAAALATVATCASGCFADGEPDDPPEETDVSAVDLDVTVAADLGVGHPSGPDYPPEAEGLIAGYTVTNNSDTPILVAERRADLRVRDVGRPVPADEETAWVYAADDGVIQLTKELFSVTADGGEAWQVPAVRVQPGQSIDGNAFALLPLAAIVPSSDDFEVPGSTELPDDATAWRFCIQVAPDPGTVDEPTIFDYTPDGRLLCSAEADLPPDTLTKP